MKFIILSLVIANQINQSQINQSTYMITRACPKSSSQICNGPWCLYHNYKMTMACLEPPLPMPDASPSQASKLELLIFFWEWERETAREQDLWREQDGH